jgi:hypothetical protein
MRNQDRRSFGKYRPSIAIGLIVGSWTYAANLSNDAKPQVPPLLQAMEGHWNVTERMWPGNGQVPVDLPVATAHRRLLNGGYIEEVMESASPDVPDAFRRTAFFEFNFTTKQFEYFSLDSRLPQMMNERSAVMDPSRTVDGGVNLKGGRFTAPSWGKAVNVPFHYRLAVGDVIGGLQTVQLFLTPESGKDRTEFLAFEYLYTRMR